ncbi:MAG: PKD domain-containing protein [bacterium]|nr:PKD domain-containing protein [bacterium]
MKTKINMFAVLLLTFFIVEACMKKPMACCEVPATGTHGQPVPFSSSCSMNANKYEWDFGDGSATSTEASCTHVYNSAGTYTVKLMTMDKKGKNMDNASQSISIN